MRRFQGAKISSLRNPDLIRSGAVHAVTFSPDVRQVLHAVRFRSRGKGPEQDLLVLWDPATGKQLRRFDEHGTKVSCLAFSPNGGYALSGSQDGTVILWDVDTGKEVRRFAGPGQAVECVAFSPDGRRALSGAGQPPGGVRKQGDPFEGRGARRGDREYSLRMWDAETGEEIARFKAHQAPVTSMAFAPEGDRILSGSSDGTIRLWQFPESLRASKMEPGRRRRGSSTPTRPSPGLPSKKAQGRMVTGRFYPGNYRGQLGQTFLVQITGSIHGSVWGTGVYTDDSSLAAAAVHAGALRDGQTGVVKVTILAGQTSYRGSTRFGVRSLSYGSWAGSYKVQRARNR